MGKVEGCLGHLWVCAGGIRVELVSGQEVIFLLEWASPPPPTAEDADW